MLECIFQHDFKKYNTLVFHAIKNTYSAIHKAFKKDSTFKLLPEIEKINKETVPHFVSLNMLQINVF